MTPRAHVAAVTLMLACAPAGAADAGDWCPPPRRAMAVAADDFRNGLAHWRIEAQDPRTVVRTVLHEGQGVMEVFTPAGVSLWWRDALDGDYLVRFSATPLPAPASAGPLAGRVSDLNMFWNASEADGSPPRPRDGAFVSYDDLKAYYVGFGANGNTTTRLRAYDGHGQRRLLDGWADGGEAQAADRRGAMTAATRLVPGRPVTVLILSRRPTAADSAHLRWWADGTLLFERSAPDPLLRGRFALRSTASGWRFARFEVLRCVHAEGVPRAASDSLSNR